VRPEVGYSNTLGGAESDSVATRIPVDLHAILLTRPSPAKKAPPGRTSDHQAEAVSRMGDIRIPTEVVPFMTNE